MNQQNQDQNEKKHNYFYKITNLINGKFYYGIHSTNKLNDGYMGSGRIVKEAIKKYGKENFIKEIIADYPTRKEASDHEKLEITEQLIECDSCYNLKLGGDNGTIQNEDVRNRIGEKSKGRLWTEELKLWKSEWAKQQELSEEFKNNMFKPGCIGSKNKFFGKTHKPEFRKKLSELHSGGNNHNAIRLIHIETNKIFDTKTQAIQAFNLTHHMLNKQITLGLFKIIQKDV